MLRVDKMHLIAFFSPQRCALALWVLILDSCRIFFYEYVELTLLIYIYVSKSYNWPVLLLVFQNVWP